MRRKNAPEDRRAATRLKAVLVTGASSGIGRSICFRLARSRRYLVFATTRKASDARALREQGPPNLMPIPHVDLAERDQVAAAAQSVTRGLRSAGLTGLYAIVNNAGGGTIAPLELLHMDALERELRTRVIGPALLVQSLLPELRKGQGRLVWITTPGPIPLAYKSSIHVPEFAVHGLARTFRIELSPWNIPSVLIECGGIRTRAVGRMDHELLASIEKMPDEQRALYGSAMEGVLRRDAQIRERGIPAETVARAVAKVLGSSTPEPEVKVGLSPMLSSLSSWSPTRVDKLLISMMGSPSPAASRAVGRRRGPVHPAGRGVK